MMKRVCSLNQGTYDEDGDAADRFPSGLDLEEQVPRMSTQRRGHATRPMPTASIERDVDGRGNPAHRGLFSRHRTCANRLSSLVSCCFQPSMDIFVNVSLSPGLAVISMRTRSPDGKNSTRNVDS